MSDAIEVSGEFIEDAGYGDPWSVRRLHLPDGKIIEVLRSKWNASQNKLTIEKWEEVEIVVTSVRDLLNEKKPV